MIELKPCPFCGEQPELFACDRLIKITCIKCNYYRAFEGYISTKISDVTIVYEDGEVSKTKFYHPCSEKEAIQAWNRRVTNDDSA